MCIIWCIVVIMLLWWLISSPESFIYCSLVAVALYIAVYYYKKNHTGVVCVKQKDNTEIFINYNLNCNYCGHSGLEMRDGLRPHSRLWCYSCGDWTFAKNDCFTKKQIDEYDYQSMLKAQEAKRKAEEAVMLAEEAARIKSFLPTYSCPRCDEERWVHISISPSGKSATWKCEYCSKLVIIKAADAFSISTRRDPIPRAVKLAVWRRDNGMCVKCGSQENIEYDHIIPVSKGGSNTERNIQILCQNCNRSKHNHIDR